MEPYKRNLYSYMKDDYIKYQQIQALQDAETMYQESRYSYLTSQEIKEINENTTQPNTRITTNCYYTIPNMNAVENSTQTNTVTHDIEIQTQEKKFHNKDVQTEVLENVCSNTQTSAVYQECCNCTVFALPKDKQIEKTLMEEVSKRMVAENIVNIVENESVMLRHDLLKSQSKVATLENTIADIKSDVSQERKIAALYKTKCEELEESLSGCRLKTNDLEEQLEKTNYLKSGVDYMLEAKLAESKAAQAQTKLQACQNELLQSHLETQNLLERIAETNRERSDTISGPVHAELLRISDERAKTAELKYLQLQDEVKNMRKQRKGETTTSAPHHMTTYVPNNLPAFSYLGATKTKKAAIPESRRQPLLTTNDSDDNDWSDDDNKHKLDSHKNFTNRDNLKTSATKKIHPLSKQLDIKISRPNNSISRLKPPVPNKPKVAPKPIMKSVRVEDRTHQFTESSLSFDQGAKKASLSIVKKPKGPAGRGLPSKRSSNINAY